MNRKHIGIGLIVIGAVMLFFSNYIAEQLVAGKMEIQKAQGQVNTIDSLFSSSKYTAPIGKQISKSAQKKIDAGKAEVHKYETIASNLKVGGIVLIALGVFLVVVPRKD